MGESTRRIKEGGRREGGREACCDEKCRHRILSRCVELKLDPN